MSGTGQPRVLAYIFGDQTFDIAETLRSLGQTHGDPLVVDFLERSCRVLKRELACLAPEQQARCPRFVTLRDLVSPYQASALNPCLVQALTCICQLGLFIRQHSSGCQVYPTPENCCLAGVCTGTLAAAAVSCAHSAPSLMSPALHTVAVAVRLGALAWDVADRITNGRDDAPGANNTFASWCRAATVSSPRALADALGQYAVDAGLPATSAPYISATTGPNQSTISGPPAVLSSFLASAVGKAVAPTTAPLPITAPYHSAHLYSDADIAHVLAGVPHQSSPRARIRIISNSAEGQTVSATATLRDALEEAARDCLGRQMALDQLPVRIAEHVKAVMGPTAAAAAAGDVTEVAIQPLAFKGAERLVPSLRRLLAQDSCSVQERIPLSSEELASIAAGSALGVSGGGAARSPIAILGASGRFPGHADTMEAFWDVLYRGVDTHELVPPSRWNASTHVGDTAAKNVSGTGFGCWLHQAARFDATFFNMSPREALQVDPAQRLALMTAAEALEQAGIVPDRTPSTKKHRVGVWFGSTSNDWMETNSAQNIDTYFIPGGNRAFIPGRINYHFKFSGPSYTIDTACSSSLAALHLACNALWRGEVDTAIVGGTNVLTNPDMTAGLDRGHFLSRTGNCKTFDDTADGYCRGEAVVTLVLKRLDDARMDNDPVQACILGVATNHNAEAESITRPHAAAQQQLFEHILAETSVKPGDISYVEMHGTGTQAGDAGETTSVVATLSPLTSRGSSTRPGPLYIGAVKASVGHGEAAAGVTSLAKVLLMMKHSTIPPHIGIKTKINHRLPDLQARNTRIARAPTAWPRPRDGSRRVLLNNFSAAGGNTAVILEDAPFRDGAGAPDPRRHHVVTISAKTPESLVSNLRNLIQWLDESAPRGDDDDANLLPKLSYTTTARRVHHRHRVAVMATGLAQLTSSMRQCLDRRSGDEKSIPVPPKAPGCVFAFTGQGSPYAGMGADLYARFPSFRTDLQRYDHLCSQMGLPSILPLFEQPDDSFDGSSPTVLQLTHVCFQMALCRLWQSFGIKPKAVVGHSLGEYAALSAAGALSQTDVIYLVGKRAQLMEQHLSAGSHAMLVVLAGEAAVLSALPGAAGQDYEVSCRNGKQNVVLGGTAAQMDEARAVLESKGIRCRLLNTPLAFHTSQVDPILAPFHGISQGCQIRDPQIPVISPTLRKVLRRSADFGDGYFVKHCRNAVDMMEAVAAAKAEGALDDRAIGIEIGPAAVVTHMVKEVVGPSMKTFASVHRSKDTWLLLTEALSAMYLAGANVEWGRYHQDFPGCHQVLQLPAYGWTLKEYWMPYVHDWSLRKGDPPLVAGRATLAFSSIYKVVKDTLQGGSGGGEAIVDIDLNSEDVHSMSQGHKVYGVPLCTPSVYADIALMIGNYTKQITAMGMDEVATEVAEMHIQSALVANDVGKQQILRTEAKFDADNRTISCTFSTVDSHGGVIEQHANCQIRFVDVEATRLSLERSASEARARMKALQAQVGEGGNTFRFSKAMIYKMIGQLADFDPKYRGLSAATLNSDTLEAAGTISFKDIPNKGEWFFNPAYLDAVSQLGGFVMNANEGVDLDREVFVNHGWGSMKLLVPKLDPNNTYHSHVKMSEGTDGLWTGDIIIFDQNQSLVGVVGSVSLQHVPKRLMEYIVNSAMRRVSGSAGPSEQRPRSQQQHPQARPPLTADGKATVAGHVAPAEKADQAASDTQQDADESSRVATLKILSEESGIEEKDLTDDVALADIGIDSLLSLVICGRLREELDVDLSERALFEQCITVGDIRQRVSGAANSESSQSTSVDADFSSTGSPDPSDSTPPLLDEGETPEACPTPASRSEVTDVGSRELPKDQYELPIASIPPAWSLYLQGSQKRSTKTLFLFPDGCGAATSYLNLPTISATTVVVGFNSPFMKTPNRMRDHSLQEVLQSYVAGVRGRQAHGPYHLGGWSAGGILAYAVAQELVAAGEEVASLTLIDSPPPNKGLDHLPDRFYDHCTKVGIFGTEMRRGADVAEPPEWLMPHFRASTALLHDYHAPPMPAAAARGMQVTIIWAGECAFDGVRYPRLPPAMMDGEDAEGIKFLTERRRDFGPGEWADLLPGAAITTSVVEGEHHFSMMRDKGAEKLAEFIRIGLRRSVGE